MASVDPVFAQWLQADGLWQVTKHGAVEAAWGVVARTTARMTTLATRADVVAEAGRQLAFLGVPLAIDEHVMVGVLGPYLGTVITVIGDRLGYDAGVDVFIIGAEDDRSTGLSRVTVIRKL